MKKDELPYQTYERITGLSWKGGTSDGVKALLAVFNIRYGPGTARANCELQKHLWGNEASQALIKLLNEIADLIEPIKVSK